MTKSLEALGYLNAKFNLDKEYPEQYEAIQKDLAKLDRFINWRKVSGISAKQRSYAEAIAKKLKIEDFDITKYDRNSIKEFFDKYAPLFKGQQETKEIKDEDVPF